MPTSSSLPGPPVPVVLIHGIPGSAGEWDTVADALAGTFQVFAENLAGFGPDASQLDLDDLRADAQASELAHRLDEAGARSAIVVGHDFGGPVALQLLAQRPDLVAGLVLLSTNTFPDTPIPIALRGVTLPVVGQALARVMFSSLSLRAMTRAMVGRPRHRLRTEVYVGSSAQARSIRLIFSDALSNLESRYGSFPALMAATRIPVTVIWGDRDPFFSVEQGQRTADAFATARFVLLHDAGHALPEERPEEVIDEILALSDQLAVDPH